MNFTTGITEAGDGNGFRVGWNGSVANMYLFENADMRFATNNSEKMRIKADGKVGIGTPSPGTNLDIQGTAAQSLRVKSDGSATIIIDSDGDNDGTAGSYLHYRDTGATKWTLYKETNNDFYLHMKIVL